MYVCGNSLVIIKGIVQVNLSCLIMYVLIVSYCIYRHCESKLTREMTMRAQREVGSNLAKCM